MKDDSLSNSTLESNNNVFVTEAYFKMSSTLSENGNQFFAKKFKCRPYGPYTYQIMYGEILDFQCRRQ